MRTALPILLLLICSPAVLAADAKPGEIQCPACKYLSYEGSIVCWACDTPTPGAKKPVDLVKVATLVLDFHTAVEVVEEVSLAPELQYEQLISWIDANPDKQNEALERLNVLFDRVRGTALEGAVTTRIEEIEKRKAEAERPKTLAEREAEAVQAVVRSMPEIRRITDRREQIRRLEELLRIAEGTTYEEFVRRELQRARQN